MSLSSKALLDFGRRLLAAFLLLLPGGAALAQPPASRLVRSLAEPTGAPLFVPADLAGRPDGSIDWDLLGSRAEAAFDSVANAPALPAPPERPGVPTPLGAPDPAYSRPIAGCLYYAPGSFEASGRAPVQTLTASLATARGVVRGRVVAVTPGFFGGDVGSLVDLEVEETLKASSEIAGGKHLRLYYPVTSFRAGSFSFCKADPAYPALPGIGDDVLVIHRRPPLDEERKILLPEPDGIFVQKANGKVEVPQALRKDASMAGTLDMTGLTSAVAAQLAGAREVER